MKTSDILKNLRKTVGAKPILESPIAKVTDFISTGSYALNRILSGNIYNGIPTGRITTIAGESQAGKSLVAANILIEALKNNKIDFAIIFDTEGGVPVDYIEQSGVDMEKIQYVPIKSLEVCGAQLINTFEELCKAKEAYDQNPDGNDIPRVLVILDSIGGLSTDKLISDSEKKGVMIPDMGQAAKTRNNLMRGLMMRVPMSGSTLVIVNHIYDDTNAGMFGVSKIKNMGGGKQIEYSSHVILQAEKLLVKANNEDYITGFETDEDTNGFYKGNRLTFFVRKSRIVKPFNQAQVYLSLEHGSNKWGDLIEPAVQLGFIEDVRGGYVVKSYSDKKITVKELLTNDKIWETFIEDFNRESEKVLCYKAPQSQDTENE